MNNKNGFGLVGLLITIVVISLLVIYGLKYYTFSVSVGAPNANGGSYKAIIDSAKDARSQTEQRQAQEVAQ